MFSPLSDPLSPLFSDPALTRPRPEEVEVLAEPILRSGLAPGCCNCLGAAAGAGGGAGAGGAGGSG